MAGRKIKMTTEDNEVVEFFVVEQTMIGNINYLLVTDSEDEEEADAFIMKETGTETEDAFYEFVEDDVEFDAISNVFAEILEDTDIVRE